MAVFNCSLVSTALLIFIKASLTRRVLAKELPSGWKITDCSELHTSKEYGGVCAYKALGTEQCARECGAQAWCSGVTYSATSPRGSSLCSMHFKEDDYISGLAPAWWYYCPEFHDMKIWYYRTPDMKAWLWDSHDVCAAAYTLPIGWKKAECSELHTKKEYGGICSYKANGIERCARECGAQAWCSGVTYSATTRKGGSACSMHFKEDDYNSGLAPVSWSDCPSVLDMELGFYKSPDENAWRWGSDDQCAAAPAIRPSTSAKTVTTTTTSEAVGGRLLASAAIENRAEQGVLTQSVGHVLI